MCGSFAQALLANLSTLRQSGQDARWREWQFANASPSGVENRVGDCPGDDGNRTLAGTHLQPVESID
jgi:hypothetical protein